MARVGLVIGVAIAIASVGFEVRAEQLWQWSYFGSGDQDVVAQGTLTTAGSALTFEPVLSFTGTRNGVPILGLVPLGADDIFEYDNEFIASGEHLSEAGILFDVGGGQIGRANIFTFLGQSEEVTICADFACGFDSVIHFTAVPVPEPETYAVFASGLAALALSRRRRPAMAP